MTQHPDGSVTVRYKLEITRGRKGQKRVAEPTPPPERPAIDPATVPRITRMLVLGYYFERLVRDREVKNCAEIARMTGLTRAAVAHLTDLTLLSPSIQETILLADQPHVGKISSLRQVSRNVPWPQVTT